MIKVDVAVAPAGCGVCWIGEVQKNLPIVDASSSGDAPSYLMSMQLIKQWAGSVIAWWLAIYNSVRQPFGGVESPRGC